MKLLTYVMIATVLLGWPVYAKDSEDSLRHGGHRRDYTVHLPPQFDGKASLPVVMVLHGGGSNVDATIKMTRMNEVADRHGFIAVYPAGTGGGLFSSRFLTWNAGRCCGKAIEEQTDDVGFISTLIDRLAKDYHIDKRRVYATGISNGSQMSYRLSCDLSTKIAAIAPVGGQSVMPSCNPTRAVPVFHIHGTQDQCAKYTGGSDCGGCFDRSMQKVGVSLEEKTWACDPVEQQIAQTARRNGCSAQKHVSLQRGRVVCEAFEGCPANADVALCKVGGGGHTWPGGGEYRKPCLKNPNGRACGILNQTLGAVNTDINASELMWEFFSQHSL